MTQVIPYHVRFHTADKWLAGTDNWVSIKLYGVDGTSDWHRLHGDHERNEMERAILWIPDVGLVTRIGLSVKQILADEWMADWVEITRKYDKSEGDPRDVDKVNGWSQFFVNSWIGGDERKINFSHKIDPQITVLPSGEIINTEKRLILAQFAYNPHRRQSQKVMNYTETWSEVDTVSVSKGQVSEFGAGVSVKYTSPEFAIGQFEASAQASWKELIETAEKESRTNLKSSTFDWSFTAPPRCAIIRREHFKIPYSSQVYVQSDNRDSRVVRKLGAEIIPTGMTSIVIIPKRNRAGKVVPISIKRLENRYLKYMDPRDARRVRREFFPGWKKAGYIRPPRKTSNKKNKKNKKK